VKDGLFVIDVDAVLATKRRKCAVALRCRLLIEYVSVESAALA